MTELGKIERINQPELITTALSILEKRIETSNDPQYTENLLRVKEALDSETPNYECEGVFGLLNEALFYQALLQTKPEYIDIVTSDAFYDKNGVDLIITTANKTYLVDCTVSTRAYCSKLSRKGNITILLPEREYVKSALSEENFDYTSYLEEIYRLNKDMLDNVYSNFSISVQEKPRGKFKKKIKPGTERKEYMPTRNDNKSIARISQQKMKDTLTFLSVINNSFLPRLP